jgi:hypothetical protein
MTSNQRATRVWAVLMLAFGQAAAAGPPPVSGAALQDRLCPATASAAPAPATVPGCLQAHCAAVGEQSVCACERAAGWRFERRQGGRVLQHWRTEISPMMGPQAFEVSQVDLDGDGQPEWLVALLQTVSNGMGVSHHSLCTLAQGRNPVNCREVGEWGALTVPVAEAGRPGCSLMDADWQPGREAGRGEGTYAAGRLLRWQGGRWVPVSAAQRPAVARRLLKEFDDERANLPQRNLQRLWYQHPAAVTAACPGALCPSR